MSSKPRINPLLLPVSWLYGLAVSVRNGLYDSGKLKSQSYPIPIICVGNLVAGGTGKTPMIEHLIRILQNDFSVAVVSRGYKRKSLGLKVARPSDSADRIGDEPALLIRKYRDKLQLIVDSNRNRAISYLINQPFSSRPDVILMDDGFQHRSVHPSLSILLSSYDRLMTEDALLPAGRLRESARGRYRADIVVLTKCPQLQPIDRTLTARRLELYPHQELLFSEVMYDTPIPLFDTKAEPRDIDTNSVVVAISGIAHPDEFFSYMRGRFSRVITLPYPDHHRYSHHDLATWENILSDQIVQGKPVTFICTEKDAVKISEMSSSVSPELRDIFLKLPIKVRFKNNGEELLRNRIYQHIVDFNRL